MLFSIVIPVFNVEPYLRECLDSVLCQNFVDWEAICVNDGSTDRSGEILVEYAAKDSRFKILTKPNGGLSSARNAGMDAAMGDYILFLDSDDWLELNALETINKAVNGEDMICFSGRRYIETTESFNPADQLTEKNYNSGMEYYNDNALLHRDFAFECVVLRAYKRSFLMDNGLLFKEGVFHEDDLFTPITCCFAEKVKQIQDSLYNYRVRANSITTNVTYRAKRLHDYLVIANSLASFFIPKQGFDKTIVYRVITHHFQMVFVNVSKEEAKTLGFLCDWESYGKVSWTKIRHRLHYLRNRFCYRDTKGL